MMNKLIDNYNRQHDYLRISLTDKCNFNCVYCNPKNDTGSFQNNKSLLSYEEHLRIIELFASRFGFNKFRFTGGEPLLRKDSFNFFSNVNRLKDKYNFVTGLTTNASLLSGKVQLLKDSGIDLLNVSLDSLNAENFNRITKSNAYNSTMDTLKEAIRIYKEKLKINCVVIKDINDNEIHDFAEFSLSNNINIRFIEFMPFGNNDWQRNGFISSSDIRNIIQAKYSLTSLSSKSLSVANDYSIDNSDAKISFISSISEHFCNTCNRLRLTSDGAMRLCLFSDGSYELNLRDMIRSGASNEEIAAELRNQIKLKWEKHPAPEVLTELKNNNMLKIGG